MMMQGPFLGTMHLGPLHFKKTDADARPFLGHLAPTLFGNLGHCMSRTLMPCHVMRVRGRYN